MSPSAISRSAMTVALSDSSYQWITTAGGELPRSFRGKHDEFKSVFDVIETIFYGYSGHDSVLS